MALATSNSDLSQSTLQNGVVSNSQLHMSGVSPSSIGASDQQKLNLYKNIKMKFYMHKSFDLQSDMEFLPAVPNEATNRAHILSPNNSPRFQYRGMDYYAGNVSTPNQYYSQMHNNSGMYPAYNNDNTTPRTRMSYLNSAQSSPRRNHPNVNNVSSRGGRRVNSGHNHSNNSTFNNLTSSFSPMHASTQSHNSAESNYDRSHMMQNRVTQFTNRNW